MVGLKNLAFNSLRYLLRVDRASALASGAIHFRPPELFCRFGVEYSRSLGAARRFL